MSKRKKPPETPIKTELTLKITEGGVLVLPRQITAEELTSEDHVRVIITQERTRFRNQDCYVAQLYREVPAPQAKNIVSQRFSCKGDPVLRADAFYKVLGAAVASALATPE